MLDKNQNLKEMLDFEEQTDIEVTLELIEHFNMIEDSVMVKFKKKAKEQLSKRAAIAMESMTNPLAKRLLKMKVWE